MPRLEEATGRGKHDRSKRQTTILPTNVVESREDKTSVLIEILWATLQSFGRQWLSGHDSKQKSSRILSEHRAVEIYRSCTAIGFW